MYMYAGVMRLLTYALIPASLDVTAVPCIKCCVVPLALLKLQCLLSSCSTLRLLSLGVGRLGAGSVARAEKLLCWRCDAMRCDSGWQQLKVECARESSFAGIGNNSRGWAATKKNRDPVPHSNSLPVAPRAPKSIYHRRLFTLPLNVCAPIS